MKKQNLLAYFVAAAAIGMFAGKLGVHEPVAMLSVAFGVGLLGAILRLKGFL